jgi:hypothetical protein
VAQPNTTVAGAAGTTLSAQANNAFTLTDSTQTTITALNGLQLNLGVPTINQNGGAVTVTTASTLYVATPAAGTSVTITNNRPIDTAAGAYLTSGGVWTSNASWARLKENINPVSVSNIYDWMRTDYQPVTYRYKADSPGTYDEVGFIWDQILSTGPVGQEFFNLVSADAQGSVSTKSSEGMLFALTHEAATRIYDLSGKVDGLSLELNEAGLINSTSTATSTADFVENHPGFVETIRQILAKLGVSIQNGIASIQSVVTQNLKIGSAQNPSGFTIYDQVTKQPYCVGIANGEFIKTAGDCASAVPGTSATSTVPTVQAAPVPAPVVAPVLPPSMISLTELPVASVAPVSGSDGGTTTAAAASAPVTTTATTTTTDTQPSTDLTAASRSSAAPATIATPTQTVTPATTDSALAPTAPATPAVSAATPDSTTTSAATTQPATDSSATN